jgi:hypothetical protein
MLFPLFKKYFKKVYFWEYLATYDLAPKSGEEPCDGDNP